MILEDVSNKRFGMPMGGCLGCMPMGGLALAACIGLRCCKALAAWLGLGSMPWLRALALAACLGLGCMPWGAAALALASCLGLGFVPWPWLHAIAVAACLGGLLHGLGCVPWPWQHALSLAVPWGGCLGLVASLGLGCVPWGGCMPWPSLRAMGGCCCCLGLRCMPCPWLRALALAACHGGLPWPWLHALALAACLGLGCVPWGAACLGLGCVPWPWQHALPLAACHGLGCVPWPWLHALGGLLPWPLLPCPQSSSDFPKNEGFLEKEVICPKEAGVGHGRVPRGMPACTPRRIAPHRPALRQNWLVPFPLFVFLNSVHDFRGRFQQAVRHSEQF